MVFESKHEKEKDKKHLLMLTDSSRDWADLKKHFPILLNYTWINDFQSTEMYFPKSLMNTLFPTDTLTQDLADASAKLIKQLEEDLKQCEEDSDKATQMFKEVTDRYDEQIADLNGIIKDLQTEIQTEIGELKNELIQKKIELDKATQLDVPKQSKSKQK